MNHRLLLVLAIFLVGCSGEAPAESSSEKPAGGAPFFDPTALEEGATELGEDFTVVTCPGAEALQRWEYHPRLIRGQVLAPQGALAHLEPSLRERAHDLFIPSAHAVPLEGESVVEDADVRLLDGDTVHGTTTTDALGRFCVVAPEGTELGPGWLLEARQGERVLRRTLLDPVDADISVQTEAVYRLVTESGRPADEHLWRNVTTLSATTLDLLDPIDITPATSTTEAITAAVAKLRADPRIEALLAD